MMSRGVLIARVAIVLSAFLSTSVLAQNTFIERNTNAQGLPAPGKYTGIPGLQDNEPSCAINPLLERNFICAWNSSAGSDDLVGDTWVKISSTITAGETFEHQFMNGSPLDPVTSVGQEFAADPITLCWPGGCGVFSLAADRAPGGGSGGNGAGIYWQLLVDRAQPKTFRHSLATNLLPAYLSEPNLFADKPYATYILNKENPGTVNLEIEVDTPDGGTELVPVSWPAARIVVAFALGDPQGDEIRILSTYTDNYGFDWSERSRLPAVDTGLIRCACRTSARKIPETTSARNFCRRA